MVYMKENLIQMARAAGERDGNFIIGVLETNNVLSALDYMIRSGVDANLVGILDCLFAE